MLYSRRIKSELKSFHFHLMKHLRIEVFSFSGDRKALLCYLRGSSTSVASMTLIGMATFVHLPERRKKVEALF